jgi:hypothetical protein
VPEHVSASAGLMDVLLLGSRTPDPDAAQAALAAGPRYYHEQHGEANEPPWSSVLR